MEEFDDVAHDHGFVLVVGDEDGGQPQFEVDFADAGLQFFSQLGVDGRQRFVQKQHLWFRDDGAGQGHTLLLTTGKIGRIGFLLAFEFDEGDGIADFLRDFVGWFFLHLEPEGDVLFHVHIWKE